MTQSEIEAFLEIVKAGSITAAAQALFVTQPALSRRIRTLEEELGYRLMERKKGQRTIELTKKGEAFVTVARKWLNVWREAQEINTLDENSILNLCSVGSVSTYILPEVFRHFSDRSPDIRLCFHNYHSFEAYTYVSDGLTDIAFISDPMHYKSVETIPFFREPMLLAANISCDFPPKVHPSALKPENEIRLPWNPEFDIWHDRWFSSHAGYQVFLDQMTLLEYFLYRRGTWAVVPASAAHKLSTLPYITLHELEEAPPDRIIYYLRGAYTKPETVSQLLDSFGYELGKIPQVQLFQP